MTHMSFHLIKCIELNCTRVVSSHISCFVFLFVYGFMRSPFSLFFWRFFETLNVISARTWYFIWLVLCCICKIDLFRDNFRFLHSFGPLFLNIVLIRRRKVEFFLSISQNVEVGFLLASFKINVFFLHPLVLKISLV